MMPANNRAGNGVGDDYNYHDDDDDEDYDGDGPTPTSFYYLLYKFARCKSLRKVFRV